MPAIEPVPAMSAMMAAATPSDLRKSRGLFFNDSTTRPGRPWVLIGALGAGMRAFAEMLLDAGERVVGADHEFTNDPDMNSGWLKHSGLQMMHTNDVEAIFNIPPEQVVYSLALPEQCPLLSRTRSLGIEPLSLARALSVLLGSQKQVCIAGTHGKTTTTAMTWTILHQSGLDPSAYVGGVMRNNQRSGTYGSGGVAVVESCEYRQSFLHLSPAQIVLTGIEPDHFDCFSSLAECDQTFGDFVAKLPADGTLIYNRACQRSSAIAATCGRRTVSFSVTEEADWTGAICTAQNTLGLSGSPRQTFMLRHRGEDVGMVALQVPGLHNRLNAVAAIAAAASRGESVESSIRGIEKFSGIRRRFEYRGNFSGIDWIDDYAHHPTAIQATLSTVRDIFPQRRLIAVFEPHQISRVSSLFDEFRSALSLADECLILPVLPARERASRAECSRVSGTLVRSISESGGQAFLMTNLDHVLGRLDHSGRPGDVVITMGAGRTHQIHDEIHRRLQRNSAA